MQESQLSFVFENRDDEFLHGMEKSWIEICKAE